jgi:hypothetical protein
MLGDHALGKPVKKKMKTLFTLALVAFSSSGCTVVHGTGEWLGIACEWVEWQHMDPTAKNAPRPKSAEPDEEVCYLTWPERGRVALASRGDDAGEVSCGEREDSTYTEDEPLVVRPGQIAWIYGTYSDSPVVTLALTTCAELDAWVADGGTPGELAKTKIEASR